MDFSCLSLRIYNGKKWEFLDNPWYIPCDNKRFTSHIKPYIQKKIKY